VIRSTLVLLVVLVIYWLALSGYIHDRLLLTLGAISVVVVFLLVLRMKILDDETVPYFHGKVPAYFSWLLVEVAKANKAVVKTVLSPDMEISPQLITVPMPHKTDMGRVSFANSITLTPGTISVALQEDSILVHALLEEMTDMDGFAEMGARAGWAVSDPGVDLGRGGSG